MTDKKVRPATSTGRTHYFRPAQPTNYFVSAGGGGASVAGGGGAVVGAGAAAAGAAAGAQPPVAQPPVAQPPWVVPQPVAQAIGAGAQQVATGAGAQQLVWTGAGAQQLVWTGAQQRLWRTLAGLQQRRPASASVADRATAATAATHTNRRRIIGEPPSNTNTRELRLRAIRNPPIQCLSRQGCSTADDWRTSQ